MNEKLVGLVKSNFFDYSKQIKIDKQMKELFEQLEFDKKNIGKKTWNPFIDFIKKGDKVVIKPNLVLHKHPLGKEGIDAMISQASVIKPIIEYILKATKKNCKIIICDVPLQSADWNKLIEVNGLKILVEEYEKKGIKIDLLDLRYEIAIPNSEGVYHKRIKKVRDPLGYARVSLGKKSHIQDIIHDYKKLEITDYGTGTVAKHHNPNKNEYLVPKTILSSDIFINMPKLKTHRKAGVTLSMKNLIGINGDKSWIAHHRKGVDEYKEFKFLPYMKWYISHYSKIYAPKWFTTILYKINRKIVLKGEPIKSYGMKHGGSCMEGNWHGNDTIWRTILDLNNIIFFADKQGKMTNKQQRKYISIVDGILGMELEGPMDGYPYKSGVLIGGFHPVSVDYVCSYIMGFDDKKLPVINKGFNEKYYKLTKFKKEEILVNSNIDWKKLNFKFKGSKGWRGHFER